MDPMMQYLTKQIEKDQEKIRTIVDYIHRRALITGFFSYSQKSRSQSTFYYLAYSGQNPNTQVSFIEEYDVNTNRTILHKLFGDETIIGNSMYKIIMPTDEELRECIDMLVRLPNFNLEIAKFYNK